MELRCKTGDLAVVVGEKRNLGALVVVIGPDDRPGWWFVESLSQLTGFIEGGPDMVRVKPRMRAYCADKALRPLRYSQGWDETLDWQPVPGARLKQPRGAK